MACSTALSLRDDAVRERSASQSASAGSANRSSLMRDIPFLWGQSGQPFIGRGCAAQQGNGPSAPGSASLGGEICERWAGVVVSAVEVLLRRALHAVARRGERAVDLVGLLGDVERRMAGDVDGDPRLLVHAALVLAGGDDQV